MKTLRTIHRAASFPVVLLLTLAVLAGCAAPKDEAAKSEANRTAGPPAAETKPAYAVQDLPGQTVTGRVLLGGKPPAPKKVPVNQDREVCGAEQENVPVRVEKGGIVDAVVWIDDIDRGKPFGFPKPVMSQKGCTYLPHMVLMQPGDLEVESKDPVPHNVHTYADSNRNYNLSMNQLVRTLAMSFMRPERINIRCDLHGWMSAYAVVARNPYYALTGAGGEFRIGQVPPGRYRLKVWQETLGEMEKDIVVEAAEAATVDFTFQPK